MGKVLDPNPGPRPRGGPAAPGGAVVYLDDAERATLTEYADAVGLPVTALLRCQAVTAVRATTRAGVRPRQLVTGAAAALGRDFPLTFDGDHAERAAVVAESVMRWLLARCAVLPLPAAAGIACGPGGASPVWPVDTTAPSAAAGKSGAPLLVTATTDKTGGRVQVITPTGTLDIAAADAVAVAAAIVAAATPPPTPAKADKP